MSAHHRQHQHLSIFQDDDECMMESASPTVTTSHNKTPPRLLAPSSSSLTVNAAADHRLSSVDSRNNYAGSTTTPAMNLSFSHETLQDDHPSDEETVADAASSDDFDEDEAERQRRLAEEEEQSSIALARMLMAEEAMASYQHSVQLFRASADDAGASLGLSSDDYQALQAAIMEEERAAQRAAYEQDVDGGEDGDEAEEEDEGELSYDAMLQLGERIGDVKAERWAMVAQSHIARLPTESYQKDSATSSADNYDKDDSEHKCLVCQHEYAMGDELLRLPCGHCFHSDCVGQWLASSDVCPYCRTSIVTDEREACA